MNGLRTRLRRAGLTSAGAVGAALPAAMAVQCCVTCSVIAATSAGAVGAATTLTGEAVRSWKLRAVLLALGIGGFAGIIALFRYVL